MKLEIASIDDLIESRGSFDYVGCDIHSKLNCVSHYGTISVASIEDVQLAVRLAARAKIPVAIAGGRHAMGGQQFVNKGILLDLRSFNKVVDFNRKAGHVKAEAGIMWSDLIENLTEMQRDCSLIEGWSIIQKPTGADNLSLGGCLSANVHGRGFNLKPIVADVVEFELVDRSGNLKVVSRDKNTELFRLVIGGYGLFGVIVSITLKLRKRAVMKRHVRQVAVKDLIKTFDELAADGHEYGDCQFAIDSRSDNFLMEGILASYKPEEENVELPSIDDKQVLSFSDWNELLHLAHRDKSKAYERYLAHYLKTDGQLYWSDTMQLSTYLDDYHKDVDELFDNPRATEIISELYVPPKSLADFMQAVRELFIDQSTDLIYGTIRLIEKDDETFLPWAKESYACVIFNLHTEHSHNGIARSAFVFRKLISIALGFGGNFFLTYHRFVEREDLASCYPQFEDFLNLKLKYDPDEIFQSQWYRHYRSLYKVST